MAGLFNQSVMTIKGLELLAKAQAEGAIINITRVAAGDGAYESGEDLTRLTCLKSERQTFAPDSVTRINDTNVNVQATFTNYPNGTPLETGYRVSEVGVFATDPDEGEILYTIATSDEPDYMPSYNGVIPSLIPVTFLIEVANADNVTITVDLDLYATKGELARKGDAVNYDADTGLLTLESDGEVISSVTIQSGGGVSITFDDDNKGVIFASGGGGGGTYVLPTATRIRLGGVKIGQGMDVTDDGTISPNVDASAERAAEIAEDSIASAGNDLSDDDIDDIFN